MWWNPKACISSWTIVKNRKQPLSILCGWSLSLCGPPLLPTSADRVTSYRNISLFGSKVWELKTCPVREICSCLKNVIWLITIWELARVLNVQWKNIFHRQILTKNVSFIQYGTMLLEHRSFVPVLSLNADHSGSLIKISPSTWPLYSSAKSSLSKLFSFITVVEKWTGLDIKNLQRKKHFLLFSCESVNGLPRDRLYHSIKALARRTRRKQFFWILKLICLWLLFCFFFWNKRID